MTTFPAPGYLSDPARTEQEMQDAFEDWLQATKELPGAADLEGITISGGNIDPQYSVVRLDTEGALPSDDLTNVLLTNNELGHFLILCITDNSRTVTLQHAEAGSGPMYLAGGQDYTLSDTNDYIGFIRSNTVWVEIFRAKSMLPNLNLSDLADIKIARENIQAYLSRQITLTSASALTAANQGQWIKVETSSADIILTLDLAGTIGDKTSFTVTKNGSPDHTVFLDPSGSDEINGSTDPYELTEDGQSCTVYCDGVEFWIVGESAGNVSEVNTPKAAEGYLRFVGSEELRWTPRDGNLIFSPDAGNIPVSELILDNAGNPASLVAWGIYYVYLDYNAGTPQLEISSTGYTTVNGWKVKSGETNKTFLGVIRRNASNEFAWSDSEKLVRSNFKPEVAHCWYRTPSNYTVNHTSLQVVNSATWRTDHVMLPGDHFTVWVAGAMEGPANGAGLVGPTIDAASTTWTNSVFQVGISAGGQGASGGIATLTATGVEYHTGLIQAQKSGDNFQLSSNMWGTHDNAMIYSEVTNHV